MKIERILIVGLGSAGSKHLQILKMLFPLADIRALSLKSGEKFTDKINSFFKDINDALLFKPNFALISSPSSEHIKISKIFAENKIHLFIEKPISNRTNQVSEFLKLCKKNRVKIHIAYNLRYMNSLIFFKNCLKDKLIGKILCVRSDVGQFLPTWRQNTNYIQTVSAQKKLGGGVLLELSHEIDYLRWIFGELKLIMSYVNKISNLNIDVEDTAHIIFHLGKSGSKKIKIVNLNMDFYRHDNTRTCIIIGEKGSLKWDGIEGTVKLFSKNSGRWKLLFEDHEDLKKSYINQWKNYINFLNDKKSNIVSGEEALKVLSLVEEIKKNSLLKNVKEKKWK